MSYLKMIDLIKTARQLGKTDTEIVNELLQGENNAPTDTTIPHSVNNQNEPAVNGKEVLIKIRNLSKTYHPSPQVTVPALKDINIDIYQGEFLAVTGPSGSGKSTFLNLLALIDEPTSGTIVIANQELQKLTESKQVAFRLRTVSMIFQFFNLIESYTALENIVFQLLIQGQRHRAAKKQALEMLVFLGLEDKYDAYPKDLSGGQQQRIAVGRALAKDSLFILADEPTAHLDAKSSQDLINLFHQVNKQFNRTIVLVSHEPSQAAQADRVITIKDGMAS